MYLHILQFLQPSTASFTLFQIIKTFIRRYFKQQDIKNEGGGIILKENVKYKMIF